MQALKPFDPIFILKMVFKKKKLSLVTGTDGNFCLSSDCFGGASVLLNQSPSKPENPICTGYW